ncbi:putative prohead assembly initiator protein/portal protein (T4 gp20-like) [Campylobacter phage CP21]|uniref:Prohead assembly initiator protein/portal protein (T4 gp20-like) n=1 Tax=Campylobacter phage CP21 TaxID=2881391 RepID=I7KIN3_9CAUD|nr:putative prohead assembly initiator protein/portal protein (T4 gp20-like) [Campylobacter phage CP21]CCH63626.1 putative prohead assembly initiator protein/portal protein (T4 gp20-like) [Campylobacter phage CP21]
MTNHNNHYLICKQMLSQTKTSNSYQKITRIRQVYTEFFMQILKRELICTKVCTEKQFQELKDSINIYFSEENQFIERMNLTLFMKRIDAFSTAKDFGGTVLPVDTLYKEIFRFNDAEIKKNLKAIQKESKNPLYKQFYRDFESGDEFSSDSDSNDEPKYDDSNNNVDNTDTEEEYDKTGLYY